MNNRWLVVGVLGFVVGLMTPSVFAAKASLPSAFASNESQPLKSTNVGKELANPNQTSQLLPVDASTL